MLEQIRASYTQPRMRIHIFALLSVSCIQKKNTQMILFKTLYRIIFRTLQKSTENYVHGKALREL